MRGNKIIGVRMDEDLRESIQQYADKDGYSVSEEIRYILESWILENPLED